MKLVKRRHGSQRPYAPITLELHNYNTAGQGGDNHVVFFDPDDQMYYSIVLETDAEYRELLSATAKAGHHVK